jgi:nitrogen fixation protein NifU and related proteins
VNPDDLYHRRLLELARAGAGQDRLDAPDGSATLDNPLCGDVVTVEVRVEGALVTQLAHRVRGCVLCQAAAALLARAPPAPASALAAARRLAAEVLGGAAAPAEGPWAALDAFAPVRGVPSRHRCVLLPFDALLAALAPAP